FEAELRCAGRPDALQTCFSHPAHHSRYMTPHHRAWREQVTRREFLGGSAAIAASLLAPSGALAAETQTAGAQAESGLLLPPLLTCPTETSIRLSAMNSEKATEAAVELRQEGMSGWERPQPALRVSPYDLLDWKLKDLSPATRYEYRVVLKHGTDE